MFYKLTYCGRCQLKFIVIPTSVWREDGFCTYECQNGLPVKKKGYSPKVKRKLRG